MAAKGGQPGNSNATKNRPWRDAINRALARYDGKTTDGGLNKLADKLIQKCEEADLAALKELGDRLEGRPAQTNILAGDKDNPVAIQEVARTIVDPEHTDS